MRIVIRNRDAPRGRALDRKGPELEAVGVFKSEKIGPKRSKTPQGYLLCEDVPIARTGVMHYMNGEVPVDDGPMGYVKISRDEDELFRPETLASFVGMPITDDHPEDGDVSPDTYQERAHGFVLNVRQGEGENADCIVCDLMVMTRELIEAIESGKREVSAGYDAGYVPVAPGRGMQVNIMGNHVALVDSARCGPRCAIGDSATVKEGSISMPILKKPTAPAAPRRRAGISPEMRKRIMDAAEEAIANAMEEEPSASPMAPDDDDGGGGGGSHTHIHIHGLGGGGDIPGALDDDPGTGMPPPGDGGAGGTPPVVGADPQPPQSGGPASVEDRLTALETGMNQILAFVKQNVQPPAAPPAAPGAGGQPPAPAAGTPPAPGGGSDAPAPGDPPKPPPSAGGDDGNSKTNDAQPLPGGDDDEDLTPANAATMDSASLEPAYNRTKAMAEVLFPGFAFPAYDAKAPRAKTLDSICGARRRVLDMAYSTVAGKEVIDAVRGSDTPLDVAKMECAKCGLLFRAAAGAMKIAKTRDAVGNTNVPRNDGGTPKPQVGTSAFFDKMNADAKAFWKEREPVVAK